MEFRYSSFLVRCWSTADGDMRLLMEHIESGERVTMPDATSALGWLAARAALLPEPARAQRARDAAQPARDR